MTRMHSSLGVKLRDSKSTFGSDRRWKNFHLGCNVKEMVVRRRLGMINDERVKGLTLHTRRNEWDTYLGSELGKN